MGDTILTLILLCVYFGDALEFEAAFENGKFEEIKGSKSYFLDPEYIPSKSLYFDQRRNNSSVDTSLSSINLSFKTQNLDEDEDFMVGMSLVFLKFTSINSRVIVETFVDGTHYHMHDKHISDHFDLPNTTIEEAHIVRSWDLLDNREDHKKFRFEVTLENWNEYNQIYLTAPSYKIKRSLSSVSECQGFSFKRKWWNCNTNEEDSTLLCLNYDLTCDGLPHCAKTTIPNPDENCGYHVGFREALQLLVYSLLTIFIVLFVAGCAKCCLRGVCLSRRMGRRPSDILEILTAESSQRPDDSPPTYDDAMKYVNEAFEESESETEQEPPPAYSPTPKEGESVCASSPMSEEGAIGGFADQSQTPTGCTCDRSSFIRPRPRSRSPKTSVSSNTVT